MMQRRQWWTGAGRMFQVLLVVAISAGRQANLFPWERSNGCSVQEAASGSIEWGERDARCRTLAAWTESDQDFFENPLCMGVSGRFLSLPGRILGEWKAMVCDRLPPINSNKILWLTNG